MNPFVLFSAIITLAALFSYVNFKLLKMPAGIGLMVMGTAAAILLIAIGHISPAFTGIVKAELTNLDFSEFMMGTLLSFLLFAGSLHIDYAVFKSSLTSILGFAFVGTLLSTFLIGGAGYFVLQMFGHQMPFITCLLFGSLISPTDPIAVMGILKNAGLSKSIFIKINGESLLNDGIGVVVFATILATAVSGTDKISSSSVIILFMREAVGGVLMGAVIGYAGYFLMKTIDHFQTEILISLAMVMGGYSICHYLNVSGPLAMVVVGLITGNMTEKYAMSPITRDYLLKFWEVIDEVLNAILFMLIGLEIMIVSFNWSYILIGLILAVLLVAVRYISLWVPSLFLRFSNAFERGTLAIMTWGGLRGGISIALVLSLPNQPYKEIWVPVTFVIVIFSVLVQGSTIGRVVKYKK